MKTKVILKIIITTMLLIGIYTIKSYCAEDGTLRMQIVDGKPLWTNITISEAYKECESLNSPTSTLGTQSLRAHLVTDADWSAMAIFTVSQYGGANSSSPSPTNSNKSGIYGVSAMTYTTGILQGTTKDTNEYVTDLFDNGKVKRYIREWPTDRNQSDFVGFQDTFGWYGSTTAYNSESNCPLSIRNSLFGVILGSR